MKKCSNCFRVKALSEFYVKRGYGHQSRCKSCNAEVCYVYANKRRPHYIERYLDRKGGTP